MKLKTTQEICMSCYNDLQTQLAEAIQAKGECVAGLIKETQKVMELTKNLGEYPEVCRQLAQAKALLAKARVGLEPFADLYTLFLGWKDEDKIYREDTYDEICTVGDIRKANSLVAEIDEVTK